MHPRIAFIAASTFALAAAAAAAPTVRITPPAGARFAVDQAFDVRVEYAPAAGQTLTAVTLVVDGTTIPVTVAGLDAAGGVFVRNRRLAGTGAHTITASATDATGTTSATRTLQGISPRPSLPRRGSVQNVIILLGDGMGVSHRTAARIVSRGVEGGYARGPLNMDTMPGTAMVMTPSLNAIVTDSAPGMQNYVTGNKAANNQEGVFPDNTPDAFDNPRIEYLSEYLHRRRNTALGIVTTADVEDATPAANAVHTANRGAGTGIVDQYLDERGRSGLAVLMGGGRRWFIPAGQFGSSRSAATDYVLPAELAQAYGVPAGAIDPQRNLIADFQAAGFQYASTRAELAAVPSSATQLLGLFGYGNMNVSFDKIAGRRGNPAVVNAYHAPDQPMLDEMAGAALAVLSRHAGGFVLMIEGAHIDKQSHVMDAERAIWDTIEFDRAVGVALDFARTQGNTLVLVTADHECSGFSVIGASTKTEAELDALPSDAALLQPGDRPARQAAQGDYELAGFPLYAIAADGYPTTPRDPSFKPLQVSFGAAGDRFEDWKSKPLPVIDSLLPADIRAELVAAGFPANAVDRDPESDNGFFLRGPAPGLQAVHTAADVPLSAFSSGSDLWREFVGVIDNTDVFFKILEGTAKAGAHVGAPAAAGVR